MLKITGLLLPVLKIACILLVSKGQWVIMREPVFVHTARNNSTTTNCTTSPPLL